MTFSATYSPEDNKIIAETFLENVALAINTERYRAVPILEYLVSINGREKS